MAIVNGLKPATKNSILDLARILDPLPTEIYYIFLTLIKFRKVPFRFASFFEFSSCERIKSILSQSLSSTVFMNVLPEHRLEIFFHVIVLSLLGSYFLFICYKYFVFSFKGVSDIKYCKLKQNNQFHQNEINES